MNESSYAPSVHNAAHDRYEAQNQDYGDYQGGNQEYGDQYEEEDYDDYHQEEGSEMEQIVEERFEEVGEISDPEKRKDFKDAYNQLVEKVSQD